MPQSASLVLCMPSKDGAMGLALVAGQRICSAEEGIQAPGIHY